MEDVSAASDEADIRTLRTPPSSRIRNTPKGLVCLTSSELQIIKFIERHEGHPCSKAQIAAAIGRNEKTVSRLLSRMRREDLVVSQAVHAESGAQLANVYRLTKWAKAE